MAAPVAPIVAPPTRNCGGGGEGDVAEPRTPA